MAEKQYKIKLVDTKTDECWFIDPNSFSDRQKESRDTLMNCILDTFIAEQWSFFDVLGQDKKMTVGISQRRLKDHELHITELTPDPESEQ